MAMLSDLFVMLINTIRNSGRIYFQNQIRHEINFSIPIMLNKNSISLLTIWIELDWIANLPKYV